MEAAAEKAEKDAKTEMLNADARLKEIEEQEKAIKSDGQYKEAVKAFKDAKEALGLEGLDKEKKEIRKEINEAAKDNEHVVSLRQRTLDLERQAEELGDEAERLRETADRLDESLLQTISEG